MMTCADARNALLETDLAELRGAAATPLVKHLATCADCRRVAERILVATDGLRRERIGRPRRAADAAAAAAQGEADRIRRARRRWLAVVPALAAAGVAVVILARNSDLGFPSAPSGPPVPAGARAAAAGSAAPAIPPVVASTARNVAVFTTTNPNIVVVWQF